MVGAWAYGSKTIPAVHGAMHVRRSGLVVWCILACEPIINTQILPYTFTDSTHVDSITVCIYFEYMHFIYNSTCIEYIDQLDGQHKQSARRVSYLVEDANLIYVTCRVGQ